MLEYRTCRALHFQPLLQHSAPPTGNLRVHRHTPSKLELLIGVENMKIFQLVLEEALKDWYGIYDVLLPDVQRYLLNAKGEEGFCPFCGLIRSDARGEDLCLKNDLRMSRECQRYRTFYIDMCHAGLMDVAVPVIVRDEVYAVVLCGQVRPADTDWNTLGLERATQAAVDLDRDLGELLNRYKEIRQVSTDELNELANRIQAIASLFSTLLEANLTLGETNDRLREIRAEQERQAQFRNKIESIVSPLLPLIESWDQLWNTTQTALEELVQATGASFALFLTNEEMDRNPSVYQTKLVASANVPELQRDTLYNDTSWFSARNSAINVISRLNLSKGGRDTVNADLRAIEFHREQALDSIVTVGVHLSDYCQGLLLLCYFPSDQKSRLNPDKDGPSLELAVNRIGQAYHNTDAYQTQLTNEIQRRETMRRISHQVLSPLHGVVGHTNGLLSQCAKWRTDGVSTWSSDELERWDNALDSILSGAQLATNMVNNFAWIPDIGNKDTKLSEQDLEQIFDAPLLFINVARVFQGVARARGLRAVHVNGQSLQKFNGRLYVAPHLFNQALMNLVDNAVKYADRGTTVSISGRATNGHGRISVVNIGVRLMPDQCELIFDDKYRTEEAKDRHPAGTGVGLPIARRIIELHGGSLIAKPSIETSAGWKTELIITIRLLAPA